MVSKEKFQSWILDYSCYHRIFPIIHSLSLRPSDCLEDQHVSHLRLAAATIQHIIDSEQMSHFDEAIQLIEQVNKAVPPLVTCQKTYSKLIIGLKIKALFHILQKEPDSALFKLNVYFPRSTPKLSTNLTNPGQILSKFNKNHKNFRCFFLSLVSNENQLNAYLRDEYNEEYGSKFMESLKNLSHQFLREIESQLLPPMIEKVMVCTECEKFSEISTSTEVLLDFVHEKKLASQPDPHPHPEGHQAPGPVFTQQELFEMLTVRCPLYTQDWLARDHGLDLSSQELFESFESQENLLESFSQNNSAQLILSKTQHPHGSSENLSREGNTQKIQEEQPHSQEQTPICLQSTEQQGLAAECPAQPSGDDGKNKESLQKEEDSQKMLGGEERMSGLLLMETDQVEEPSGGMNPSGGVNLSGGVDLSGGMNPSGGVDPSGGMKPSEGMNPSGGTNPSGGINLSGSQIDGGRLPGKEEEEKGVLEDKKATTGPGCEILETVNIRPSQMELGEEEKGPDLFTDADKHKPTNLPAESSFLLEDALVSPPLARTTDPSKITSTPICHPVEKFSIFSQLEDPHPKTPDSLPVDEEDPPIQQECSPVSPKYIQPWMGHKPNPPSLKLQRSKSFHKGSVINAKNSLLQSHKTDTSLESKKEAHTLASETQGTNTQNHSSRKALKRLSQSSSQTQDDDKNSDVSCQNTPSSLRLSTELSSSSSASCEIVSPSDSNSAEIFFMATPDETMDFHYNFINRHLLNDVKACIVKLFRNQTLDVADKENTFQIYT